jgi:TPR repeat protein
MRLRLLLVLLSALLILSSVLSAEGFESKLKAAEEGHAWAQYSLGVMYAKGDGVPEDDAEAAKWYRKAAEQGDPDAQGNLGILYALGSGVPEDYVQAYMWFNLAAAQGDERVREGKVILSKAMTKEQIAEAQKMSREWMQAWARQVN